MNEKSDEGWLEGITRKRPETALVLHQLLITVRRKGSCTAEDAHNIPVTHPNVRGAAMKLLGKCGCCKRDVPIRGTTKESHGHWLHVWEVRVPQVFMGVHERLKQSVTTIARMESAQMEML